MPVKKLPGIGSAAKAAVKLAAIDEEILAQQEEEIEVKPAETLSKLDNKCPHCKHLGSPMYNDPFWVANHLALSASSLIFCYNCGRSFTLKGVPELDFKPSTQKARGVVALKAYSVSGIMHAIPKLLLKVKNPLPKWIDKFLPSFARPCPPSPEHGFVESRLVQTYEEAEQVRQETLAANEDSELMFMDHIKATLNTLWTPTMLAIGAGHDGATAGKDCVSVPLMGLSDLNPEMIKSAGIGPGKDTYVEAVLKLGTAYDDNRYQAYLTQLRGGPILPVGVGPDIVPETMIVQAVVKTNGEDLLEWAKVVKDLKGKPGIVVWHPGGALTDHYSVHCRENGVPIVLSYQPVVGTQIEPSPLMPDLDPHELLRGLVATNKLSFKNDYSSYVRLLLMSLHNSAVLRGPHSYWIGVGIGSILKLGVAALEAEARHAHSCYAGMKQKPDIYGYYTARSLSFLRARLSRVSQILHYGFGDPAATHSFGGRKWALCGAALVPLFNGIKKLAIEPTPSNASELVLALNIAVNQAHNGGWWLNKFVDVGAYDRIPLGSMGDAILSSPAFWEGAKVRPSVTDEQLKKFVTQVSKWPETEIKPLKWRKVSFDIAPGAFVLNLKAATLPTPKTLTIPATASLVKAMLAVAGELRIERGQIDLVRPGGEIVNIWKEIPLVAESRDVKRR